MKQKKYNILAVHQGFELYGSDRSFLATLEAIKRDVPNSFLKVVIPQHGSLVYELNKIVDDLIIEDIGSVTTTYAKKHPIKSIIKIIKNAIYVRKHIKKVDIVYVNTIVPFGYLLAGFFTLKPFVIHVREIPSIKLATIFSLWFKISRFYLLYNSNATQKVFKFDIPTKSMVIWNGVDSLKEDNSIVEEDNLIHLLIIGRINRWKGQLFFAETFNKLPEDIKKRYKVYIVGEAPLNQNDYYNSLTEYIKDEKLDTYIKLFPFDASPEKYYTWSDIIVVPSTNPEPFGRIAIEAMSIGKIVIAADHGGLSEIVEDEKTGFLFEPRNHGSLSNILITLSAIDNLKNKFYDNSINRYKEHFTLKAYQNKFIKFIKVILEDKK
ncbi:MAG TPA: glycosyltransferase [Flavobacteriaceae bacterium]|nr:glycosyltransferase [Flavobacteriaceae bacterium]